MYEEPEDPLSLNKHSFTDNAVTFYEVPGSSHLDYLKEVGAIIGSSHIHSFYKNDGFIKLYLTDKLHVKEVSVAEITILGHRLHEINSVPSRIYKVGLSNVDPIIPDGYLENILRTYGVLESPIIRQNLTECANFAHIDSCTRYATLRVYCDIPASLEFTIKDIQCKVYVALEEQPESERPVKKSVTKVRSNDNAKDYTPINNDLVQLANPVWFSDPTRFPSTSSNGIDSESSLYNFKYKSVKKYNFASDSLACFYNKASLDVKESSAISSVPINISEKPSTVIGSSDQSIDITPKEDHFILTGNGNNVKLLALQTKPSSSNSEAICDQISPKSARHDTSQNEYHRSFNNLQSASLLENHLYTDDNDVVVNLDSGLILDPVQSRPNSGLDLYADSEFDNFSFEVVGNREDEVQFIQQVIKPPKRKKTRGEQCVKEEASTSFTNNYWFRENELVEPFSINENGATESYSIPYPEHYQDLKANINSKSSLLNEQIVIAHSVSGVQNEIQCVESVNNTNKSDKSLKNYENVNISLQPSTSNTECPHFLFETIPSIGSKNSVERANQSPKIDSNANRNKTSLLNEHIAVVHAVSEDQNELCIQSVNANNISKNLKRYENVKLSVVPSSFDSETPHFLFATASNIGSISRAQCAENSSSSACKSLNQPYPSNSASIIDLQSTTTNLSRKRVINDSANSTSQGGIFDFRLKPGWLESYGQDQTSVLKTFSGKLQFGSSVENKDTKINSCITAKVPVVRNEPSVSSLNSSPMVNEMVAGQDLPTSNKNKHNRKHILPRSCTVQAVTISNSNGFLNDLPSSSQNVSSILSKNSELNRENIKQKSILKSKKYLLCPTNRNSSSDCIEKRDQPNSMGITLRQQKENDTEVNTSSTVNTASESREYSKISLSNVYKPTNSQNSSRVPNEDGSVSDLTPALGKEIQVLSNNRRSPRLSPYKVGSLILKLKSPVPKEMPESFQVKCANIHADKELTPKVNILENETLDVPKIKVCSKKNLSDKVITEVKSKNYANRGVSKVINKLSSDQIPKKSFQSKDTIGNTMEQDFSENSSINVEKSPNNILESATIFPCRLQITKASITTNCDSNLNSNIVEQSFVKQVNTINRNSELCSKPVAPSNVESLHVSHLKHASKENDLSDSIRIEQEKSASSSNPKRSASKYVSSKRKSIDKCIADLTAKKLFCDQSSKNDATLSTGTNAVPNNEQPSHSVAVGIPDFGSKLSTHCPEVLKKKISKEVLTKNKSTIVPQIVSKVGTRIGIFTSSKRKKHCKSKEMLSRKKLKAKGGKATKKKTNHTKASSIKDRKCISEYEFTSSDSDSNDLSYSKWKSQRATPKKHVTSHSSNNPNSLTWVSEISQSIIPPTMFGFNNSNSKSEAKNHRRNKNTLQVKRKRRSSVDSPRSRTYDPVSLKITLKTQYLFENDQTKSPGLNARSRNNFNARPLDSKKSKSTGTPQSKRSDKGSTKATVTLGLPDESCSTVKNNSSSSSIMNNSDQNEMQTMSSKRRRGLIAKYFKKNLNSPSVVPGSTIDLSTRPVSPCMLTGVPLLESCNSTIQVAVSSSSFHEVNRSTNITSTITNPASKDVQGKQLTQTPASFESPKAATKDSVKSDKQLKKSSLSASSSRVQKLLKPKHRLKSNVRYMCLKNDGKKLVLKKITDSDFSKKSTNKEKAQVSKSTTLALQAEPSTSASILESSSNNRCTQNEASDPDSTEANKNNDTNIQTVDDDFSRQEELSQLHHTRKEPVTKSNQTRQINLRSEIVQGDRNYEEFAGSVTMEAQRLNNINEHIIHIPENISEESENQKFAKPLMHEIHNYKNIMPDISIVKIERIESLDNVEPDDNFEPENLNMNPYSNEDISDSLSLNENVKVERRAQLSNLVPQNPGQDCVAALRNTSFVPRNRLKVEIEDESIPSLEFTRLNSDLNIYEESECSNSNFILDSTEIMRIKSEKSSSKPDSSRLISINSQQITDSSICNESNNSLILDNLNVTNTETQLRIEPNVSASAQLAEKISLKCENQPQLLQNLSESRHFSVEPTQMQLNPKINYNNSSKENVQEETCVAEPNVVNCPNEYLPKINPRRETKSHSSKGINIEEPETSRKFPVLEVNVSHSRMSPLLNNNISETRGILEKVIIKGEVLTQLSEENLRTIELSTSTSAFKSNVHRKVQSTAAVAYTEFDVLSSQVSSNETMADRSSTSCVLRNLKKESVIEPQENVSRPSAGSEATHCKALRENIPGSGRSLILNEDHGRNKFETVVADPQLQPSQKANTSMFSALTCMHRNALLRSLKTEEDEMELSEDSSEKMDHESETHPSNSVKCVPSISNDCAGKNNINSPVVSLPPLYDSLNQNDSTDYVNSFRSQVSRNLKVEFEKELQLENELEGSSKDLEEHYGSSTTDQVVNVSNANSIKACDQPENISEDDDAKLELFCNNKDTHSENSLASEMFTKSSGNGDRNFELNVSAASQVINNEILVLSNLKGENETELSENEYEISDQDLEHLCGDRTAISKSAILRADPSMSSDPLNKACLKTSTELTIENLTTTALKKLKAGHLESLSENSTENINTAVLESYCKGKETCLEKSAADVSTKSSENCDGNFEPVSDNLQKFPDLNNEINGSTKPNELTSKSAETISEVESKFISRNESYSTEIKPNIICKTTQIVEINSSPNERCIEKNTELIFPEANTNISKQKCASDVLMNYSTNSQLGNLKVEKRVDWEKIKAACASVLLPEKEITSNVQTSSDVSDTMPKSLNIPDPSISSFNLNYNEFNPSLIQIESIKTIENPTTASPTNFETTEVYQKRKINTAFPSDKGTNINSKRKLSNRLTSNKSVRMNLNTFLESSLIPGTELSSGITFGSILSITPSFPVVDKTNINKIIKHDHLSSIKTPQNVKSPYRRRKQISPRPICANRIRKSIFENQSSPVHKNVISCQQMCLSSTISSPNDESTSALIDTSSSSDLSENPIPSFSKTINILTNTFEVSESSMVNIGLVSNKTIDCDKPGNQHFGDAMLKKTDSVSVPGDSGSPEIESSILNKPLQDVCIESSCESFNFSSDDKTSYLEESETSSSFRTNSIDTFVVKSVEVKPEYDDIYSVYKNLSEKVDPSVKSEYLNFPLKKRKLEKFLDAVRRHANPKKVALKVLENNQTPGALKELIIQLYDYFKVCNDSKKQLRISRLIMLLNDQEERC